MGLLPTLENCCFCVDLKIGTILICIYTIFIAGGCARYAAAGPCHTWSTGMIRYIGYGIAAINVCLVIAAILLLIYVIFDLEDLSFACPTYVWIAKLTCILTIALVILQYVLSDVYDKQHCHWIPYIVVMVVLSLMWIYWALVVKSFCDDS